MYRKLTAVAFCCLITIAAICQKKNSELKFGDIKPEDFKPEYYSIDSSADAINLYDVGSTRYEGNSQGWFSVIFKVHERIRLLHKKSFDDLATVKIPLYTGHEYQQKFDDLEAATYNLEDGKVTATKIDKGSIFKDKEGDYQVSKFTFPNLKEGSIIEYTFTVVAPVSYGNEFVPSWAFQDGYPHLWSEYTIEVPQFFEFVVMTQGYLQPVIDTASLSADNFHVLESNGTNASQVYDLRSNTIKHTWAYKNVPATKEEKFITALSNYSQKLQFQLSAHRFPDAEPKFFMHTWPETIDQLMKEEDFGQDLSKGNGWLKDDVKDAVQNETNALNKAQKIYAYVQNNYSCTDYSAIYLSQSLKKTEQLKKGNVADINMLLIAMLRAAGLTADPVLLSTRDHGKTYDIYPLLNKFNYLIARINIDDNNKTYLLDATDAVLGFGHLKEECYNGNARVIAAAPVLINLSADSLRQSEVISLFMSNGDDGKITGNYKHVMNEIQSENMREKMKKANQDDFFKDVKKSFSFDVDLDNKLIDSLKQPELPVAIEYDLSFKPEGDVVYFTPLLGDGAYKENPFSAAQRFYPVEMPYCTDKTYILNMEIPAGYKVDELPKSARVSLNETDGMFEYLIQQTQDHIQLRCSTKLNKATFEPDDYETLRNFFAFVVEKESEQIVFKKL